MNLDPVTAYRSAKAAREKEVFQPRSICLKCRLAKVVCDCEELVPFDPQIQFVILIHPEEVRRRIATGRLSHFLLKRSLLIEGESFETHPEIEKLTNDTSKRCFVLYPGKNALNLTNLTDDDRSAMRVNNEKLVIFVMDGTWRTAKKMLRLSPNLARLPQVSFDTPRASNFQIRKQPSLECLSTIEAIHHVIELLGENHGFDVDSRAHDHLLEMFDKMVQRQIDYQYGRR